MYAEDGTWLSGDQYLSSVYHQYVPSRDELGSSRVGRVFCMVSPAQPRFMASQTGLAFVFLEGMVLPRLVWLLFF